ncbi:DNA mismatch repair protein-like protein pms1 [Phyllosticta citrichinensis]|uniref:DNA mismatch repair protein-like protein pms1 n=1 Tax=Phyllosticta citrichinensis TaxID=1130410 RepID=A0ABR1XKL9_9PEZI
MATITPIEGRSVHQIQSGQVIVDLCSVVKELVENSLDAGATSIDVRFKNNGLESIEVQDNGHGIAPADYDTIALKHYTSKLSSYSDLNSLRTFGFRGEALSSLCALSHFHILTARASDGAKGTRLDFELSGKLKGTSVVASQRGTTVVVENLFHNLPVRRKELEKNIKREYGKVLGLLHAYACISSGVRFAVSNQAAKGKKVVVFSTKANPSTRENIANVYGAKTLSALIPLDLTLEMAPASFGTQTARNWSTQEDVGTREVKIVGHISRPVVGEGRQTPDRQMVFVNSRPCSLPQVSKAINDVYKGYNVTQSPFIFANLVMDTSAYDVNVSPDKRTILLHDQSALLEALKEALVRCFEEHDQSVPQAQVGKKQLGQFRPLNFAKSTPAPRNEEEKEDNDAPSSSPPEPNGTPVSLMQKFASRDVMSRSQVPAPAQRRSEPAGKEKPKPMVSAENGKQRAEMEPGDSRPLSKSVVFESSSPAPVPISPLSRPVQDFNARIGFDIVAKSAPPPSSDEKEEEVVKAPKSPGENNTATASSAQNHQESASQSSAKGPIQNAFDRMRPKRAPPETATITIGDKTTTMAIGTPAQPNKKRRIHTPKYGLDGKLLDQSGKKESGKLGGFVSALKMFRAPGTQVEESSEAEDEIEDGETDGKRGGSESAEEGDGGSDRRPESLEDSDGDEKSMAPGRIAEVSDDEANSARELEKAASTPPQRRGSLLFVQNDEGDDDEYLDEETKKQREDARVVEMIAKAEEAAAKPSKDNIKRATSILKGRTSKQSTLQLVQTLDLSVDKIGRLASSLAQRLKECQEADGKAVEVANAEQSPEERLSLTVTKADFSRMRIIGQFNLGFILAVRPATFTDGSPAATPTAPGASASTSDDLFIIDQHASDEKINFERLSATYILTPQRLVHPLPLSLTAIEEETILSNPAPFAANGFLLETDTSGEQPVGQRCRLLGVPVAKEMGLVKGAGREEVFGIKDLEELIVLVGEMGGGTTTTISQADDERHGQSDSNSEAKKMNRSIPRPAKVRKSLAMRACRSSIMIGRYLTLRQMRKVVDSMGEIDKPWNCPHGRPTMRHLAGLAEWHAWQEGDGVVGAGVGVGDGGGAAAWRKFLRGDRSGTGV